MFPLLIARLALLLTACLPIPTEDPPTPVPTPQMQAGLHNFASLFSEIDFSNTDDADISDVTTQPQLIRNPEQEEQRCSFSPHSCIMGGRAFGPPLCRGCAPATPPSKTIAHRPCVLIPAVRLQQRGCRQPNTQSDSLNGGSDKGLVKTDNVYGLVVTAILRTTLLRPAFHTSEINHATNTSLSY